VDEEDTYNSLQQIEQNPASWPSEIGLTPLYDNVSSSGKPLLHS
jgi:hypothetical protein